MAGDGEAGGQVNLKELLRNRTRALMIELTLSAIGEHAPPEVSRGGRTPVAAASRADMAAPSLHSYAPKMLQSDEYSTI